MQFLQQILDSTDLPFLSAFILGIMTALSPCPLATNITAIGFISRDIENKRKVFLNGLIYTAGRAISYTTLGMLLYFGASKFQVASLFSKWGEKFLGPLLILIGIMMLDVVKINFPAFNNLSDKIKMTGKAGSSLSALLLGIVFALAFCPYSGVLYFGMLIPMTVSSASGLYLPLVFAIATGLPVILFAWLIANAVGGVGVLYKRIKDFEYWFRRVVAVLFILAGFYYIYIYFIK
jgi:cytochrome c biogenesis protein CcdA